VQPQAGTKRPKAAWLHPAWPVLVEPGSKPRFLQHKSDGERVTQCGETGDFQGILWFSLAPTSRIFVRHLLKLWLAGGQEQGQRRLDIPPAPRDEMPCPSPSRLLIPRVSIAPWRVMSCLPWPRQGSGRGTMGPHLLLQQGHADISVPITHG